MSLSSIQLDAFVALSRTLNFSRAAEALHITQSALSQRIRNLEKDLGLTLFLRDPKGVQPTEAGSRLLRYCRTKDAMELELLEHLRAKSPEGLAGHLRLAGYSTIMESVVIPALAPLLRKNPRVRCEFGVREMRELPGMLRRGESDLIILDHAVARAGLEARFLGSETYVLAESARFRGKQKIHLDHDPEDATTENFFRRLPGSRPVLERSYMGDINAVMKGVALGLGRGVLPNHLLGGKPSVKIVKGFKPHAVPVVLNYFSQPYYSKLQQEATEALAGRCRLFLRGGAE